MTRTRCSVSDFKARCASLLHGMQEHPQRIEVTHRGRIIAVVTPPEPDGPLDPKVWLGSLRGSVLGFDRPTGPAVAPEGWNAPKSGQIGPCVA